MYRLLILFLISSNTLAYGTRYKCGINQSPETIQSCATEFTYEIMNATAKMRNQYTKHLQNYYKTMPKDPHNQAFLELHHAFEEIPTIEVLYLKSQFQDESRKRLVKADALIGENYLEDDLALSDITQSMYDYMIIERMNKLSPQLTQQQLKQVVYRRACVNYFLEHLKKYPLQTISVPLIYSTCYQ